MRRMRRCGVNYQEVPFSMRPAPDRKYFAAKNPGRVYRKPVSLIDTPMSDLDLMIRMGWGNTPRENLPDNWREVRGPGKRT